MVVINSSKYPQNKSDKIEWLGGYENIMLQYLSVTKV